MPWFKDKCVLCLMSDMSVKSVCETVRKHTELLAGGMCVLTKLCCGTISGDCVIKNKMNKVS